MVKTHPDSRMVLLDINGIANKADVVLQSETTNSKYENGNTAYLCEVVSSYRYNPKTNDDLAQEIVRLNAENRKLRNSVGRLENEKSHG